MQLRDIMTSEICCANPSESLVEVAAEMKRHNVGAMPICQDGKLVGILTDRDIVTECVASGGNPKDCKVSSFMSPPFIYGTPDMDIGEAAQLMGREQIHRLPVVDGGRLVGLVSIGDLAVHFKDDKIVAQLLRDVSVPVRSFKMEALAA